MPNKVVATNRKAHFEYFLMEHFEAGISLKGSEIKSIRAGQISIAEAYVQIENNQAWLMDAYVAPYEFAGRFNHDPKRPRRLLLQKREIRELAEAIQQKGMTIIPVQMYIKDGIAKLDIATAKGKKLYDKREAIAKRDAQRALEHDGRK
jgi:SsrA-binding protein